MKVLHVIPSLCSRDGGPSFALPLIAKGLSAAGVQIDIATTGQAGEPRVAVDGAKVFVFPRQCEFYKVSLPFSRWLSARIDDYDLVHIHALFSYASYRAASIAMKQSVPYIVRPLGVLNRWGLENRRRRLKQLSFRLIERRILQRAAAVHYTSRQEKLEAEQSGVRSNAAVIPIGLDLSTFRENPGPARFHERFPKSSSRKIVLYLSRLDPKKGLDLLLRAFAQVHGDDHSALLVIAGNGEQRFEAGLRESAVRLGIADDVLWTGFLEGTDKLSALAAATLFVLPSYSENFGIAPVEAMAAGLPCVLSDQVGIAGDLAEYDAGFVVPCQSAPLADAISQLLGDSPLRSRLTANAHRLVNERFSVEVMTDSLVALYEKILTHRVVPCLDSVAVLGD